jgi:glycosyltransferase involved in cell wall biosynthesis
MKILVVPHAPQVLIRTRSAEIADRLVKHGHHVDVLVRSNQPAGLSWWKKVRWNWQEYCRRFQRTKSPNGIGHVETSAARRFGPLKAQSKRRAVRAIEREAYDLIVTAAYEGFLLSAAPGGRLIYDLVDDHADGFRQSGNEAAAAIVERFVREQMARADAVIVSSRVLEELARTNFGRESLLVPNGASVPAIRKAGSPLPGSENCIGYMGGLDHFVKIRMLVDAIRKLRDQGRPIELVVIGDGPAVHGWDVPPWVRRLGFRKPAEMPELMRQFRVGTVPFELSPFTDAALPLKVIEYGAARMPTVSTPLRELQLQQLPWVSLVPLDVEAWASALSTALDTPWNSESDAVVDLFDWDRGAQKLLELANSLGRR